MLPRSARLTRGRLTTILKRGVRIHGRLFTCVCIREGHGAGSVVVSKKVAPTAVLRHKVRRRVYSTLSGITLPAQMVFIAKEGAATATFDAVRADITQLISRAL